MPRPPIAWIAAAFAAGLAVGVLLFMGPQSTPGARFVIGFLGAVAVPLWRRAPLGAALALFAAAGMLWGGAAARERSATCAGMWSGEWGTGKGEGHTHSAFLTLSDPVSDSGGVTQADVVAGAECGGSLRVRWPGGKPARGGTTWVVVGRWSGDADRGVLVARTAHLIEGMPRGRGAVRDALASRADRLFGARAPMVQALVIGRRSDLDPAIREQYVRAGLAHLLAIAGLHIGFFAVWVGLLLELIRVGPRARAALTLLALAGYIWMLGFPAPAARAGLMFGVRAVARVRQRVLAPAGLLGLCALLLLVFEPFALLSAGAWLSFTAVGAVIWAGRISRHWPRLLRLGAPALAATLLTAPVSALAFGTVAPIGAVSNLLALPVAGVVVPGLVTSLALSWLNVPLAQLFAAGSGAGLALLDLIARGAAWVPFGHVVSIAGWQPAAVWTGVVVVAWWLWNCPRRPWLLAARLAFAFTVAISTSLLDALSLDVFRLDVCRCLQVFFLDVGQGDAALLRTPENHWIVIDGGPRTPDADAGRRTVIPFLRRARAGGVSIVVATHGDADHLGGLPAVIQTFPPRLVLEPGEPLGRPLYLEFLAAVEATGARYRAARSGDRIALDGVTLDVLSPDSAWIARPLDVNEHGVVLRVTYGSVRLLFQADAGLPVEAHLAGRVGSVELLKVGHHGSHSATSDAWLTELAPHDAVISVGRHNHYGHPAPEVVARLAQHGITVMRTDRDGTITFSTDGARAHDVFARLH
ncbi:MAG TPA: DNA internalization-related competence protein ComEC/Rec2 [Gemmatimonadales bacterium]|nr:DNA internalization-related competence protein ComEC/Rec2 [Gemmatimonadales bacterium]